MKVIRKSDVVASVPNRWRSQYPENSGDKYSIWKALKAEKNLTENKADEIIGNDSWTRIDCDECDKSVDLAVQLGDKPDYESSTATICVPCLKEALKNSQSDKT